MNCEIRLAHLLEVTLFVLHFAFGTMDRTQSSCNDIEQIAGCTVLESINMEDLEPFRPRWVQASDVNTPAMYVAALTFKHHHPQKMENFQWRLLLIVQRTYLSPRISIENQCQRIGYIHSYISQLQYLKIIDAAL